MGEAGEGSGKKRANRGTGTDKWVLGEKEKIRGGDESMPGTILVRGQQWLLERSKLPELYQRIDFSGHSISMMTDHGANQPRYFIARNIIVPLDITKYSWLKDSKFGILCGITFLIIREA
jgi:hypothetical protein